MHIVLTVAGLIPSMELVLAGELDPKRGKAGKKSQCLEPDKAVSAQVPTLSLTNFVRQLLRALHSLLTSLLLCFLYLNKNYSLSFHSHG